MTADELIVQQLLPDQFEGVRRGIPDIYALEPKYPKVEIPCGYVILGSTTATFAFGGRWVFGGALELHGYYFPPGEWPWRALALCLVYPDVLVQAAVLRKKQCVEIRKEGRVRNPGSLHAAQASRELLALAAIQALHALQGEGRV